MRLLFVLLCGTALGEIPLSFEPNTGQAGSGVRYLARGSAYTLYLTDGETVLAGKGRAALRTRLAGAKLAAPIDGEGAQDSFSNYFVGNDPRKWRTSVPNFGRVRYRGLYPGIDLVYYGHDGDLEYDWVVGPGADPRKIRMAFEGRMRIDSRGDLVVTVGETEYRHRKPVVYQEAGGSRVAVAGRWSLHGREAGFRIGDYDRGLPLVIDPVLIYSTYHGGSGLDYAYAVAVDSDGNTYVTGSAGSADFPITGALQNKLKGSVDVFVTKINASGSAKIYSTFLGGGGVDGGNGIAVDGQGNAYVTGAAGSFDFPMVGAIQGTWGGSGDAFVAKLDPSGSALVYSTYLGGSGMDYGTAIALDPVGNAYVTGVTFSADFPTAHPFQAAKGAQQDAFVAKINPSGTAWVYSTYLGGNAVDEGYGIAADASGNAYVTGYTGSSNFPLQSALRGSNGGSVDAFVTKLNPAGSALVYSTYLGGSATDYGTAIAVDSAGRAYVTGIVESSDFPVVNPMQAKFGGGDDAFVTKLSASGSGLVYSTFLGGGSTDDAYAIAVDLAGNAYVTGRTNSSDFPLTKAIQITRFAFDMFVTELDASGSTRLFSTFIGGTGSESGRGIAVDRVGNIHIAGESTSTDFPVLSGVQMSNGGGAVPQDGIVLLLGDSAPPVPALSIRKNHTGNFGQGQQGATYSVTVSIPAGAPVTSGTVTVTETVPAGETLVSMAGTGWSCAGVSCTRGDSVAAGSGYPAIAVTVNVASNAAATVTNQVSVSRGGETENASDPTIVVQVSNGHPSFFDGETDEGNGLWFLKFPGSGLVFGYYNYQFFPILYHYDMGFESFVDANDGKQGAYLYDFATGHFFYTTPGLFPYLYDFTLNCWLYYYPDSSNPGHYTSNPRTFLNLTTGKMVNM